METYVYTAEGETPDEIAATLNELIGNHVTKDYIAEAVLSVTMTTTQHSQGMASSYSYYHALAVIRVRLAE